MITEHVSYFLDTSGKSAEDTLHVAALLHGDDTDVVLLIDPDQEVLVCVVAEKEKGCMFKLCSKEGLNSC